MLLSWLLNGHYGLVNQILGLIGIEGPAWLNDPKYTKISLMIMDAWRCGGTMIIYLAALRSVPASLYEAAELDGANGIKKFFHITVPCISPTIEFNVIMSMIGAFQYLRRVCFWYQLEETRSTGDLEIHCCFIICIYIKMHFPTLRWGMPVLWQCCCF